MIQPDRTEFSKKIELKVIEIVLMPTENSIIINLRVSMELLKGLHKER